MQPSEIIDEEASVSCRYCHEPELHWTDHYRADGTADRLLFNARNRPHTCNRIIDDFKEVV